MSRETTEKTQVLYSVRNHKPLQSPLGTPGLGEMLRLYCSDKSTPIASPFNYKF